MENEERTDTNHEPADSPWPWLPDPKSVPAPLLQRPHDMVSDWISSEALCDVCSKLALPDHVLLDFEHRTAQDLERVAGAAVRAGKRCCPLCALIWKRMRDHFVYYCHDRSGGCEVNFGNSRHTTNTFARWADWEAWRDKGEQVDTRARDMRFSQLMSENAETIRLTRGYFGSYMNIINEASLDWDCIEATGSPLAPHEQGHRNIGARTLRLYTFPDAPAARQIENQIPWRTLQHAAQYTSSWTRQCLRDHTMCSKSIESPLPKRLIDVGVYGSADRPRIWINPLMTSASDGDPTGPPITGTYLALSYCWGLEPFEVVNPENLARMTEGISVETLPLTIQDAMEFTRLLGIRYLWVDSLCILQGESVEARADWKEQSVKMHTVYQNAFLTIGAAMGKGAHDGIRPSDDIPEMRFCALPKRFGHTELPGQVYVGLQPTLSRKDPIHTRAWTLQEFLLSTRYINLGRPTIFWYCKQVHYEQMMYLKPQGEVQSHPAIPRGTGLTWWYTRQSGAHAEWQQIVDDYTERSISRTEDRLVALSGLANDLWLRRNKQDEYWVGLWKSTITMDLVWSTFKDVSIPLDPTLPSWSWASQRKRITYDDSDHEVCSPDCAQFLGSHFVGAPAHLAKRSIRLNGWIKKALFQPGVGWSDGNLSENENTPRLFRHVSLDRPMDRERQPPITMSNKECFEVLCLEMHRSDSGLILLPESIGSNRYVRVGMFYSYEFPTDFFSGERCDVELV